MTTVRCATAHDFYEFARDELMQARLCLMVLQAIGEDSNGAFVAEATGDGLELLVGCLVRADEWRRHARRARRNASEIPY